MKKGRDRDDDEKSFDRFCDLNRAVPSVPSFYSHFYTRSFVVSRYMFDEFALGEFWGIPIKGPPSSHSRTDESALRFPFFFFLLPFTRRVRHCVAWQHVKLTCQNRRFRMAI